MEKAEQMRSRTTRRAASSCPSHTTTTPGPVTRLTARPIALRSMLTLREPDRRWFFAATGAVLCLTGCVSAGSSSDIDQPGPQSATTLYTVLADTVAGSIGSTTVMAARTPATRAEVDSRLSPVVLSPVNINRHFDLLPLSEGGVTQLTEQRQVKVVGTYYPKGIYSQPDAASRVLMRIAPGTMLELERQFDSWYRVTTAEGTGYLRADDGRVEHSQASD